MSNKQINQSTDSSFGAVIIAAICIVIYVFALVQAAVRTFLSVEGQKITTDAEFDHISNTAMSRGAEGFMSEAFIEAMNNALAASDTIEALIISGPDGEYAFEKQRGRAVTWINNSPRFNKKPGLSSVPLYKSLPFLNIRNVNIQGVANIFNYPEIVKILKETLLLILAGFSISFFTMLIQLLRSKPSDCEPLAIPENTFSDNSIPPNTESIVTADDSLQEIKQPPASNEPKGLYSPRSGIGWEEYTSDRLDSELHRCASMEKDLTFIVIEFPGELHDIQFRQAAEEVASFFTSRDLLFERGKQGISVICPGLDLDAGIDKAQKFKQRIKEKIFFNHNDDTCVFIGLSARAGRLLNAKRLLLESNEALTKAKTDKDTSIIAFKSDLEKYRKFIASQSPGRS